MITLPIYRDSAYLHDDETGRTRWLPREKALALKGADQFNLRRAMAPAPVAKVVPMMNDWRRHLRPSERD